MNSDNCFRKKYTLLVKKLRLEHTFNFVGLSLGDGCERSINAVSEVMLNEEITLTSISTKTQSPEVPAITT